MDDDVKRLLETMQQENVNAHTETRHHFHRAVAETKLHFEVTVAETKSHFDVAVAETKRHFDVAVEHMDQRFDLLAESVLSVNVELQRTRTTLDEKIDRTAAETQSMIKFSHKELDRRVTALEDAVSGLQARMERLEDSAH